MMLQIKERRYPQASVAKRSSILSEATISTSKPLAAYFLAISMVSVVRGLVRSSSFMIRLCTIASAKPNWIDVRIHCMYILIECK